ncbi:MAG: DUF1015 domain-containing protein [Lachnospiraceae bacterium]|nr:DUF1015 domain-containing protein [Lachnospiraceae bacterium]
MSVFSAADILLPQGTSCEAWSVIACDQFTSQPEYWEEVRRIAGDKPSTVNLILPEADLGAPDEEEKVRKINLTMEKYMEDGVFQTCEHSMVYVERTLLNGSIRKGLIGKVDLDAYDYNKGSTSAIRATEKTVVERIPPRMRVRRNAPIELPHILMLCDDHKKMLIEPIGAVKDTLPKLYDFDLMQGGGHISGWLVDGKVLADFEARLAAYAETIGEKYEGLDGTPVLFAVGDGNHSLATAKACYEELKAAHPGEDLSNHPARWALVELENIHDEAQVFEPIHRIVTGVEPEALLKELEAGWCAKDGYPVTWFAGAKSGTVYLDPAKSQLTVGVLQAFLDDYLSRNSGEVDYIHGDDTLADLAKADGAIGFLLPPMEKSQLFRGVVADGALPRKTFSMGHAQEKRYYLEGRKIR